MKNKIVEFNGQTFDLSDRTQRIEYSMRMWHPKIKKEAFRLKNVIANENDLYQEAVLAIIRAADAWSPDGPAEFSTFSFTCIKNGMIDAALRNKFALSVPSGSVNSLDDEIKEFISSISNVDGDTVPDDTGDPTRFFELQEFLSTYDRHDIGKMYFVENRTLEEISEKTGISRSTVARLVKKIKQSVIEKFK